MWDNEVILRLSTVALLVGYLIYMQWGRARKRAALRRQLHRSREVIQVTPIDVALLRPRLEEVRRNYGAEARSHLQGAKTREFLVAAARRKLGRLPFFRNHPAESGAEHHTA